MKVRSIVFALVLGVGVVAAAQGCGSSSSNNGGGGGSTLPGVGETKSVQISAASGGSVSVTGGTINIPAGALAADTTISVTVKDKSAYAHADQVAVNVFDYGPNGTTFLKPVAMTLDLQGVAVPSGKTAMIAYFDGSNWQTLPDSAVAGGKVTASTMHFTPFTVVFVGGSQTGGGCGAFTACGGSIVGTWNFTGACASVTPTTIGSPWNTCPTSMISASVDVSGTAVFNADMTYQVNFTETVHLNGTLPDSCLSGKTCQQVAGSNGTGVDSGGTCTVTGAQANPTNETGTYTVANNSFQTTKQGSSTPSNANQFCVNGNMLTVQVVDSKGNTFQLTATK
jgi:hypothetical protein